MKRVLFLICISFVITNSCKNDDENSKNDADLFVGVYMGIDKIEIEKIDVNSIKLNFIHTGGWDVWNHSFYATVSGATLTIPAWQYWELEDLDCSGDGFLIDGVLTINYYYSNGHKELGVTYEKIH